MFFKEHVKTLTNEALEEFILEWRRTQFTWSQMRNARGVNRAEIALAVAFKERDLRAKARG